MTQAPPGHGVYTIAAGVPFLDALAAGVLQRHGAAPEALVRVTVLLPTRRACRSLAESFLRLGDGKPMLLPKMTPLGDIDEEELILGGEAELEIPPAIPGLRRQLLLARMIMARGDGDTSPEQAAQLARELARLLDQVQTERLSFDGLAALVDDAGLSEHWRRTLDFLTILTDHWPSILAEEGTVDPADRRNRLLEAQAARWRGSPPPGPVIAAGSTGSIPATADLLKTVAGLPGGAVVLPGLDRDAEDAVWEGLEPSHPQYGLANLLRHLGVERDAVADWPTPVGSASPPLRTALINQALMPAAMTDRWRARTPPPGNAFDGVDRIEADGERDEAAMIALVLRRTLETEGKTAALVTPDRGLARRVAAELARWDIDIDDSAGTPLMETPPGAFFRLCARVVADGLAPVGLLSLLKHPFAAGGLDPAACRRLVRRLERAVLRGPRPAPGLDGLAAAVAELAPERAGGLDVLIEGLQRAASPFAACFHGPDGALTGLLAAHVGMAESLAASDGESGSARLWAGEAGEALAGFVAELNEAAPALGAISAREYPALIDALLAPRAHRPRYGRHPRLFIWGLLEARLQQADVMILGGLNEGGWPPEAEASPWMSRPMLERFGLSQPERRLGLAAHDFTQAAAAPEVILSRAARSGGSPSVPSRWLLRLETLFRGSALEGRFVADGAWNGLFRQLDRPGCFLDPVEPRPTPPLASRPRKLSVSRVETWIRDPYSIYARDILKLKPLDPIDADPGAADRGTVVHEALDRFVRRWPDALPDDALGELLKTGSGVFDEQLTHPAVRAFWWPRFERIAAWFVDNERARRRAGRMPVQTETDGEIRFAAPGGAFTLNGRADRIDRGPEGLVIIDYKTGGAPSQKQVASGLAPQLTLEAAMAQAGRFDGVAGEVVSDLVYMQLSGGRVPGRESGVSEDVETLAADALQGLQERVATFDDEATPYLSRPVPQFARRFGDYDHLARVREWMDGDDDGGGA